MSEQDKLSKQQINDIRSTRVYLGASFTWGNTEEGHDYWHDVDELLRLKVKHGTSDGKPYIEPERWRVPTDEDAKGRPKCRVRDNEDCEWQGAMLLYVRERGEVSFSFTAALPSGPTSVYRYCEILDTPSE